MKDSKNNSGPRTPAIREKKAVNSTQDIELGTPTVESTTDSIAAGSRTSPTGREHFERAYVKRDANATISEDDLRTGGESDSIKRFPLFPHTVF